jgi:hypothetical protein
LQGGPIATGLAAGQNLIGFLFANEVLQTLPAGVYLLQLQPHQKTIEE